MPLISIDKFVGGLHSDRVTSEIQLNPADCTDVLNVEYYPRGAISKREGYTSYNLSASPITGVMAIFAWKDSSFTNANLVYTSMSGSNVSAGVYTMGLVGDTMTLTPVYNAATYGDKWNPTLSANEIHVASFGGSAVAVAGAPGGPLTYASSPGSAYPWTTAPSGAKYIAAWGQYLFLGNVLDNTGTRKRSRIQWNSAGSMDSWPASYYIDLDPDDGDEVTGMRLLGDYMTVFKRHKIFIIYWQGGSLLFQQLRRSSTIGCIAGRTIVERDQKLFFLAEDGFYSFDGTNTAELSKKIKNKVYEIDQGVPWLHHAEVYEAHRQIWFGVSKVGDGQESLQNYQRFCNRIFVYDWELDNWTIYDIAHTCFANVLIGTDFYWYDLTDIYNNINKSIGSYVGSESSIFLIGHANWTDASKKSCISKFGGSSSDITNSAINAYWQSIWFDLGDPTTNKRFVRWTVLANQESTTNTVELTASLYEDYKSTPYIEDEGNTSVHTIPLTGTSGFNTGYPLENRIDTSRTCRAFQIKLENGMAAQGFTVHKMVVDGYGKGRTKVS